MNSFCRQRQFRSFDKSNFKSRLMEIDFLLYFFQYLKMLSTTCSQSLLTLSGRMQSQARGLKFCGARARVACEILAHAARCVTQRWNRLGFSRADPTGKFHNHRRLTGQSTGFRPARSTGFFTEGFFSLFNAFDEKFSKGGHG